MANRGELVKLVVGMVGMGGGSIFFGYYLLRQGWRNLIEGRVPLGGKVYLTGFPGRAGALVLVVFGASAVIAGAVLAGLCLWRLPSLIAGE